MSKNLTPRINKLESNLVIDGGMEIWPEGTSRSITNGSSGYGSVLMKLHNFSSGITVTTSRQASIPSGTSLLYSNQISKTVAGTLAAGTFISNIYFIEGNDLHNIFNSEFSVVFFVKSSVASNRSVSLRNGASTHSYVRQYSINQANLWELKVLRFDSASSCPGALDRSNGVGLSLTFNVVAGSNSQTSSLDQWISGNFSSGIGEDTTWLTGTNHDFSIAGVMVLPGNWESLTSAQYQFVRAGSPFSSELSLIERYVETNADLNQDWNTAVALDPVTRYPLIAADGPSTYQTSITLRTRKRASPSVYLRDAAGNGSTSSPRITVRDFGATLNNIVPASVNANQSQIGINTAGVAGLTNAEASAYNLYTVWLADARF